MTPGVECWERLAWRRRFMPGRRPSPDGWAPRLEDGIDAKELAEIRARHRRDPYQSAYCNACEGELWPCDAAQLATDSLDAAWAEAEAALPEGWQIITLEWAGMITDYLGEPIPEDGEDWRAIADALGKEDEDEVDEIRYARGPSPAAALRALATKLRERIAAE